MYELTLETAKGLIEAAERKARSMGLNCDIAIVDAGGNLVAFHRMDRARIAGIRISQDKAWTSAAMQMPTENLAKGAQPGGPMFGINTTNDGRLVILPGGIPLVRSERVVGAIGVSGGTSAQDAEVAAAAVQAFESMREDDVVATGRIGSAQVRGFSARD
ncbi:GlcG/HbpS family heme-binding protein [Paenibacillus guangzhouensis]|uniref:GlcG/HbpS family heme-binding protein n=1 Tax=Paenibacillus guangzhouensis TaxID=1473112 RepID=UPI0012676D42|nr:heme-binding protein [Paenibacillus guangzhouensis]